MQIFHFLSFWMPKRTTCCYFTNFYIIWHSESGKLEQINQINQSKSMS